MLKADEAGNLICEVSETYRQHHCCEDGLGESSLILKAYGHHCFVKPSCEDEFHTINLRRTPPRCQWKAKGFVKICSTVDDSLALDLGLDGSNDFGPQESTGPELCCFSILVH